MDNQDVLKNAPEQSCKSIAANLSEWKCPHCYQDYNGLSIDSSIEMNVSIISCSECGLHFGDKCSEEELIKKFKKEYVMDKPMREMSLIELISSLPESHIARREYTEFLGRLSKEKNESAQVHQEVEELKRERDELLVKLKNVQAKQVIAIATERKRWAREDLRALAKCDLEQQAKALIEFSEQYISDSKEIPEGLEHKGRGANIYNWQMHFARELRYRANKLKTQAKELV